MKARPRSSIDQYGNLTAQYPCYDFLTLGDLLTSAGVSWKSYAPANIAYNAYNAINHIYNNTDGVELDLRA